MAQGDNDAPEFSIDPLVPAAVARKAELIGAAKMRMDAGSMLALSVLGGGFIAFGAVFFTTVLAGAAGVMPFGVTRLMSAPVFCLGLILIVVTGAELFTGNALMVMAVASRKATYGEMLRAWTIAYVGNFIGSIGTVLLVFLSGQYRNGGGSVGRVAVDIAVAKVNLPFDQAFFLAILCNLLVCLAVWMSYAARTTVDKVAVVLLPISAFVAAGFEHSVANMYFIPIAILIKEFAPAELWPQLGLAQANASALNWSGFIGNLIPVTLGNIVGGSVFVGAVYWFIYLRPREADQPGRVAADNRPAE